VLVVISSASAAPGRRDDLVAAARAVAAATRADPGCRSYGFYSDLDDPERIVGLEIWTDRAALDAHMAHSHTHRFLQVVPGLLAGEPVLDVHEVPDAR
jgi:quinol monooxygenase YgiN